jgi:hypothetical protein
MTSLVGRTGAQATTNHGKKQMQAVGIGWQVAAGNQSITLCHDE